jgi:hypothetical protein
VVVTNDERSDPSTTSFPLTHLVFMVVVVDSEELGENYIQLSVEQEESGLGVESGLGGDAVGLKAWEETRPGRRRGGLEGVGIWSRCRVNAAAGRD